MKAIEIIATVGEVNRDWGNNSGERSSEDILGIPKQCISQTLKIDKIKRVEFQVSVWIPGSSGSRKIRGPEKTTSGQQIWQGVPVTALNWQRPYKTAMLRLGAIVSGAELEDLISITADNIYVVQEIVFESPEKMTIKVAPVER